MPRGPRPDAPGLFHHVTQRGVGGRDVFLDDLDREDFVARLERLIMLLGFRCLAWALMSNHFHLALQTGSAPLANFMLRLTTGYAKRFNHRHGHVGHVFQNRYGSRVLEDDGDLANVVVYVNANPLEAGIVASLDELSTHPWAGYSALAGLRRAHAFESMEAALGLFADDASQARAKLARRVLKAEWAELPSPESWCGEAVMPPERQREFAVLAEAICARRGVRSAAVRSGRRNLVLREARAEIARRAMDAGFDQREIARELRMSAATVCRILQRARVVAAPL